MSDDRAPSAVPVAALAVVGALLVVGGGAAAWITERAPRTVGGVTVAATRTTPGIEVAPTVVPLGLVALAAGLAVLAGRGRARRAVGVVLVAAGAAAAVAAATGLAAVLPAGGTVGPGPALAAGGALAVVAAGARAAWAPASRPALAGRYTVEGADGRTGPGADDEASEWRLASADEVDPPDGDRSRPVG